MKEEPFVSAPLEFIKSQRERARKLKKTRWWKQKLEAGVCYHCGRHFLKTHLSMDHLIPLARGGHSDKNNIVLSCKACNSQKQHRI